PAFEAFLREGIEAWPAPLRERYAGLADWHGLPAFTGALRALTSTPAPLDVFLTNRTSHLMRLAARLLFRRCRAVLITDLEWPAYWAILEHEARRTGQTLIEVPLRGALLEDRCGAREAVEAIAAAYHARGCEGIFLSAVTYQGVRVPVEAIA